MANTASTANRLDGGTRYLDAETGVCVFGVGVSTVSIPTGLSSILAANFTPVVGTAAYSTVAEVPAINLAVTGTATGSAAGVVVSGTGLTVAVPSTAAAARSYLYRLEGVS